MQIIIVEDEIKIRNGLARLIESEGKHDIVALCKNGVEGLAAIQRYHPDVVVTDVKMPYMDGLQMLKEAKNEGLDFESMILSGFSEFDYAKKAIQLGVNEYLLKPIDPIDLKDTLERIEEALQRERCNRPVTEEDILTEMIRSENRPGNEEIVKDTAYDVLLGYVAHMPIEYREHIQGIVKRFQKQCPGTGIYHVFIPEKQFVVILIEKHSSHMERINFEFMTTCISVYREKQSRFRWSKTSISELNELKASVEQLFELLRYTFSSIQEPLIEECHTRGIEYERLVYPMAIETEILSNLYTNHKEVLRHTHVFIEFFRGHTYHRDEVLQSYIRLATHILEEIKKSDDTLYRRLSGLHCIRKISAAVIIYDMEKALEDLVEAIIKEKKDKEDVRSYAVMVAINFLREHYHETITLEGVADQLSLTPEYLSGLFYREVGINFSVFLKHMRISNAKRLLATSQLKAYEIGEKVGYRDPKYFTKVFKEIEGVTPGDYRKKRT